MEVASIRSTVEVNAVATIHQDLMLRAYSSVQMVTLVTELITESKNFITQINTKLNFVPRILNRIRIKNAIIKNFVPSPTILKSCRWNLLKIMKLTWTSTCSTSRLCGVRTVKMITIARFVCMLTTGRTIVESHRCSRTRAKCAQIGRLTASLHHTLKVALISTNVNTLMDGRSKNIIQTFWRSRSASMVRDAPNHIAPTTIQSMTAKCRSIRSSDISRRVVNKVSHQTFTYLVMVLQRI